MFTDDLAKIVIDLGSSSIRSGAGGDDGPGSIITKLNGDEKRNFYEANWGKLDDGCCSDLKYPIVGRGGQIADLDDLEGMLQFIITKRLKGAELDSAIIIGYNSLTTVKRNRVGMAKILFEKFQSPVICLADRSLLSLIASGRTTGLVFKSGDGITQSVPISDGQVMTPHCYSLEFAGRDLTEYLERLIYNMGYVIEEKLHNGVEHFKQMKKLCGLSMEYYWETQRFDICNKYYEVGDQIIPLEIEQFKCPEALFQPSLINKPEQPSIHELILKSLSNMEHSFKKDCLDNLVLSGGNTMFPNFSERLTRELTSTQLINEKYRYRVLAPPERPMSSWIGGSILSCLTSVDKIAITKTEFEEIGDSIIHRKHM